MWKISLSSLALVATIAGGVVVAWPMVEPYMAATRGYARELTKEHAEKDLTAQAKVERVLHHIQLDAANGKLEATDNDLFKAQLEMKKTQDPSTQEFIAGQINKLQATKQAIENQIRALNSSQP